MVIRRGERKDGLAAGMLAGRLWDHDPGELSRELAELMGSENAAVFLAWDGELPVGFAQAQLRTDYVEGTESSPVGYLEGIYVEPEARRQGVARQLLGACQDWARARGCREFASDCELDNTLSQAFHEAVGFTEANRIVCYVKRLEG